MRKITRIRKLQSQLSDANERIQLLADEVDKLRTELSNDMKTVRRRTLGPSYDFRPEYKEEQQITISGKVDKIIEHLGLDITVLQKQCTPAKVTVSPIKKKRK